MANFFESAALSSSGRFFCDPHGRALLLRGINCSGMSKLPSKEERIGEHISASFTGRPFPLSDARQHFERLAAWGFSLVRLVITWEAIQPDDPARFDESYLSYLRDVAAAARDCGLLVLLDSHQDCWSRHSGGSGAPSWTFSLAGLHPPSFPATGAALFSGQEGQARRGDSADSGTIWATNYTKFACTTLFTLFWGGEVFAPNRLHAGENVGVFLRRTYTAAIVEVCHRLRGLIMGVDLINEPHPGFLSLDNLHAFDPVANLHLGCMPTPLQSMMLADGFSMNVPVYDKTWVVGNGLPTWPLSFEPTAPRTCHVPVVNADKVRAWSSGVQDVWRQHGVWDLNDDGSVSCNHTYFSVFPPNHARSGQKIDFIAGSGPFTTNPCPSHLILRPPPPPPHPPPLRFLQPIHQRIQHPAARSRPQHIPRHRARAAVLPVSALASAGSKMRVRSPLVRSEMSFREALVAGFVF
jgi:hypothetical protein